MALGESGETIHDAIRHIDTGNAAAAEAIARSILKRNARDVAAMRVLGLAAALRHQPDKAVMLIKRCIAKAPDEPVFHRDLGKIFLESGRFDESLEAYSRAIKMAPNDLDAVIGKADVLEKAGRFDDARAMLLPYFEKLEPTLAMCAVMARLEQQLGEYEAAISTALRRADSRDGRPRDVGLLLQIAGQCCEKLGDYQRAFELFSRAKKTMARPFDRASFRKHLDSMIAIFTRENIGRLPKGRDRSELPIFIVALPRSGSTLVEQIIHAHPEAYGAGEIPHLTRRILHMQETIGSFQPYPACIADLTQTHVDEMAAAHLKDLRQMAPGKKRVVDKLLDSYLHLGMISVLFPGARVIYVERDPLDNCFGIFMANLDADRIRYSADLEDIGFVHGQFMRMMRHWNATLDINMLHVKYEDIVADSDTWIRRIIDFTGLKWHEKCLRYYEAKRNVITLSYDQVRKPIYTSAVARWKKYEMFLDPLKKALREEAQA